MIIPTKEELFSNETVSPADMRKFLKTLVNSDNYVVLTRLSNLKGELYIPIVNSLYFHFINIRDLQQIDLFNNSEIIKLLEEVVRKNFIDTVYTHKKAIHHLLWYKNEGGLGLGEDLIYNYENERTSYIKENVQNFCNYYDIYTHTVSYYAYPSEVIFEQNFSDMVLPELLGTLETDNLEFYLPQNLEWSSFSELTDEAVRADWYGMYEKTIGVFKSFLKNDTIVKLAISSNYRLNQLEIHDNLSQSLWNWSWPLSCSSNLLNDLVNAIVVSTEEAGHTPSSRIEEYLSTRIPLDNYKFNYGSEKDLANFFLHSELRYRFSNNTDEHTGQEMYLAYLDRFKTLIRTLCDITRKNMKVSSPLNLR